MDNIQLKVYNFFKDLPQARYSSGEAIIKANEKPAKIYYIEKGIVEVRDLSVGSTGFTVNIFKAQAYFPMAWAINHKIYPYTYIALNDVTVRTADPDEVLSFIKSNPDVMLDLLSRVIRGADGLQVRLVLACNSTSTARLLYEILLDAYRFGESTLDYRNNSSRVLHKPSKVQNKSRIYVKQSTLAMRSGLARETVSRELQKIEQQGFIVRKKQNISVNIALIEKFLNI